WGTLIAFLLFCTWLYHWQKGYAWLNIPTLGQPALPDPAAWWNSALDRVPAAISSYFASESTLGGIIRRSAGGRSFYYTLAYSLIVVIYGIRRIRRRRTPYVFWQTLTLAVIQVVPLFLLPEIILPWMQMNGY